MKQPIALILTDTHLSENNIPLVTDIWQQAVMKCIDLQIKKIFFVGDFFTSRKAQPLIVDNAGRSIIDNLIQLGIELTMIAGNHDKVDLESTASYLDEYYAKDNCLVVLDYHCEADASFDDLCIHFLPYFKENGSYLKRLSEIKIDKSYKNILITHIAVSGVKNNDGSKQENDLDPKLFKQFDSVLVGHFHNQSKLGDNIYYIGSAYQANYGEDNEKGFTILYDDGSHEFVKSKFPEYIKLKVDISDTKKIKQLQKEHAHSKDNVRIVFTGDETQLASLSKEKFNELGIDVKFDKEIIRQDLSAVLNTNINFNRSNIKEAFAQFCELNDYQDKEMGLSYLEKIGL